MFIYHLINLCLNNITISQFQPLLENTFKKEEFFLDPMR